MSVDVENRSDETIRYHLMLPDWAVLIGGGE